MGKTVLSLCDGIQHIGIPTADLKRSRIFYESLGFTVANESTFDEGEKKVIFLKGPGVMLEVYENPAPGMAGAINHIAMNCKDVEDTYQLALEQGYHIVSEEIEFLAYWENGVRFFMIEGPDRERVEFNQRL